MTKGTPKSAVDIVLERLKRKDAESGEPGAGLSDAQKAGLAEARRHAEARIAERKILHASKLATVLDPADRLRLEDDHQRELTRIAEDRDAALDRIRRGGA